MTSLPPMFSLATPEKDDDVLIFVLRRHLPDCYEWMYFQFTVKTISYGRRNAVIDGYARKGLQMSVDRIRKNKPAFNHRHHGTWLILRSCTRSALILLTDTIVHSGSHTRGLEGSSPKCDGYAEPLGERSERRTRLTRHFGAGEGPRL